MANSLYSIDYTHRCSTNPLRNICTWELFGAASEPLISVSGPSCNAYTYPTMRGGSNLEGVANATQARGAFLLKHGGIDVCEQQIYRQLEAVDPLLADALNAETIRCEVAALTLEAALAHVGAMQELMAQATLLDVEIVKSTAVI